MRMIERYQDVFLLPDAGLWQKFLEESYKVNVFDVFNENFHEYKLL